MAGAELSVYHVATVRVNSSGELSYVAKEAFDDDAIALYDPELVSKLDAFVSEHKITSRKIVTDTHGKGTCSNEEYPDRWPFMRDGVAERAAATKAVAEEFGLVYVPLQEAFDDALRLAPVECWLSDGVHPTPAGHEIIKKQWLKAFDMLNL